MDHPGDVITRRSFLGASFGFLSSLPFLAFTPKSIAAMVPMAFMKRAGASSTSTYVEDVFATTLYTGNGSTQTITTSVGLEGSVASGFGEVLYSNPGTFNWTVPAGVTSVCVLAIGGGSGAGIAGGGGGGVAYKNSVTVTPGATINVIVGAGGTGTTANELNGNPGGSSSFDGAIIATGGNGTTGGSFSGIGVSGYTGGNGASYTGNGGVGGNAGVNANGGNATISSGVTTQGVGSADGAIGGPGGGAGGSNEVGGAGGGAGGGSGLGYAGTSAGGAVGSVSGAAGGKYGGGGAGPNADALHWGGSGGTGAVRIMWGGGRSFPANAPRLFEPAMVWIKGRSGATANAIYDTVRGATNDLVTESTNAQTTQAQGVTAFASTGFNLGTLAKLNTNNATYSSWTFRKSEKFFDIVTWTGDGTFGRFIPHSLGATPGFIIVKPVSAAGGWKATAVPDDYHLLFNTTNAHNEAACLTGGYINMVSATQFKLNDHGSSVAGVNAAGVSYIAYVFGNDASSGGIIRCGTFTTDAFGTSADVNIGWEPQFVLQKNITVAEDWMVIDSMRGSAESGTVNALRPNNALAEGATWSSNFSSNGFTPQGTASSTFFYVAIRRGPMRAPTLGTQVFAIDTFRSTAANPNFKFGFPTDLRIARVKNGVQDWSFATRMTGATGLISNSSTTDYADSTLTWDFQNGMGKSASAANANNVGWGFRRAAGFLDVVTYRGTSANRTVTHNLRAAPELMITKMRETPGDNWYVYHKDLGVDRFLTLNSSDAQSVTAQPHWGLTAPTNSQFSLGSVANVNMLTNKYVAYLFASCPGVSKVGSYMGDANAGKVINCGFTNGARFVLIKRIDAAGDWWLWDSMRGIVAGSEPYLALNTNAAEVTVEDSIDYDSSGFAVNQVAATSINVAGASYIFLAIA